MKGEWKSFVTEVYLSFEFHLFNIDVVTQIVLKNTLFKPLKKHVTCFGDFSCKEDPS